MPLALSPATPPTRACATRFLVARRQAILARAEKSLGERTSKYAGAGAAIIHARLDALFTRLVEAVAGDGLRPLLEHADLVADDRFHDGFGLGDVQAAYNALEEAVWIEVFDEALPERHACVLPLVSGSLGAAKDELALRYVALASERRAPAIDVAALFRGLERP